MSSSPLTELTDLISTVIMLEGKQIDSSYMLLSIQVQKEVNKIPTATIEIADGDPTVNDYPISNDDQLKPGTSIEIKAGYHSNETTIFKGVITKLGLRAGPSGSHLTIECRDTSAKMTSARKNKFYKDVKDSDVMESIIASHSLSSSVKATTYTHKEIVQYYCTDWDYILSRADVNGMVIIADDGKVTIDKPLSEASALQLTYGFDIIEFNIEMDSQMQFSGSTAASWDPSTQSVISSSGSNPTVPSSGNITPSTLSDILNSENYILQSGGQMSTDDLKSWADAQLIKSWMSRIQGKIKFQGNAGIKPGVLITLDGVGKRFNGDVYINSIVHELSEGNWITTAGIGLSHTWFADDHSAIAVGASGLLPAVKGLQIGVVKQIDEDPANEFRVLVKLPVMQQDNDGIWARLIQLYASDQAGYFFFPEIDDEVILGFLNEDPRFPVIVGSVYSSSRKPVLTPDKKNSMKALITKSQLKIEFDDENKILKVLTPGNNFIELNDKDQLINITDQQNNSIKFSSSGIEIKSASDIILNATGKISMSANTEIDINAQSDVKITGLNISNTANVGFTGKGNATAELSASGQTTVKGAVVMIN